MRKLILLFIQFLILIAGIAILLSSSVPSLSILGALMIFAALIWIFLTVWKHNFTPKTHSYPIATSAGRTRSGTGTGSANPPFGQEVESLSSREEKKKRKLDEEADRLSRDYLLTTILIPQDVRSMVSISMDANDVKYISQRLISPLFGFSIWDIQEKINEFHHLTEDQISVLLRYGSDRLIRLFASKASHYAWKMSDHVFDQLCISRPLVLLKVPYYSAECFKKLIVAADAYVLSGYRRTPASTDEKSIGSFINCLYDKKIAYYEDADTDAITLAESHFPDQPELRTQAFDKLFAHGDLVESIERLDDLTEYEAKKIFGRGIKDEVDAILNRNDCDDYLRYLSPLYVVKAVLGVIESDYPSYLKENFDFTVIPKDEWNAIFAALSAEQLANADNNGECDIIELLEEYLEDHPDYAALREQAFAKLLDLDNLTDSIENWDSITPSEAKNILERNKEDELEALFDRSDSDDIIETLPDDFLIKVRLGLWEYDLESDAFDDAYQERMDTNEAFKSKVESMLASLKQSL